MYTRLSCKTRGGLPVNPSIKKSKTSNRFDSGRRELGIRDSRQKFAKVNPQLAHDYINLSSNKPLARESLDPPFRGQLDILHTPVFSFVVTTRPGVKNLKEAKRRCKVDRGFKSNITQFTESYFQNIDRIFNKNIINSTCSLMLIKFLQNLYWLCLQIFY